MRITLVSSETILFVTQFEAMERQMLKAIYIQEIKFHA